MTAIEQLKTLSQLITPVEIPDVLRTDEFRFCRVGFTKEEIERKLKRPLDEKQAEKILKDFKKACDGGWQKEPYKWNDPDFQSWLTSGGNYGVIAGSRHQLPDGRTAKLFLMDADDPKAFKDAGFLVDLPKETLTVRTGRIDPAGGHVYLLSNIISAKAHIQLGGYGHFKFERSYLVGPGSLHPSGRRYELTNNQQPAYVEPEILTKTLLKVTENLCLDLLTDMQKALGEKINPCLRRITFDLLSGKATRLDQATGKGSGEHTLRLAWGTALVKSGFKDEQIHDIARHFDDYGEPDTQKQIDSVRKYVADGGNYHPCSELKGHVPTEWCQACEMWTPSEETEDKEPDRVKFSPEIEAKAKEIIESGKLSEFWVQVFRRRHRGDSHIPRGMLAANLTPNIKNSHGIAVLQVEGESGDGKSHAVLTTAQQMGDWCDVSGLSPMALLYHAGKTVFEGMMVIMDDNRPDDRQADIVKRAQTQFKTGYKYKTVVKGKEKTLQMPPGVQLLMTEVDADSEDQVMNRTMLMEASGSPQKDQLIINDDLKRLEAEDQPLDDPDILVCQAALNILKSKTYIVTIPEATKRIQWKEQNKNGRLNLRNYNIFTDLVLSYAVMSWMGRVHRVDDDGVVHLEANKQDFMDALALYQTIHKQMKTKLTSKELELLNKIQQAGGRLLKDNAQQQMKVTRQRIDALIHGKNRQGGLLGKYPGFYVEDVTENENTINNVTEATYTKSHISRKYLCITDSDKPIMAGSWTAAQWVDE